MSDKIFEQIRLGRTRPIQCYIRDGHDIEALDAIGNSMLMAAAEYGKTSIAKLLVQSGADVSVRGFKGHTPLHWAARWGDADLVEMLIECDAKVSARDECKLSPLHWVANGGFGPATAKQHVRVITTLLKARSSIDPLDSVKRTPLWYAAATSTVDLPPRQQAIRLAMIQALVKRGANPNRKAKGSQGSPLDAAHGLHQRKKYRREWPEAIALLTQAKEKSR